MPAGNPSRATPLPAAQSIAAASLSMKGISLGEMEKVRFMNRVDAKYLVPDTLIGEILLRAAPFYDIQELAGIRIASYETLYLDTPELDFYLHHVNGKLNRRKVRVRSYLDCDLHFMEVKRKTNKGKTRKFRVEVPWNGNPADTGEEAPALVSEYGSADLSLLKPLLYSRFKRITLVNLDRTERVTLDFDLSYQRASDDRVVSLPGTGVVEIKREKYSDSPLRRILRDLRIKKRGFSKYCLGILLTELSPKTNRYKLKIRFIQKKITQHEPAF